MSAQESTTSGGGGRITRDDLEAGFRDLTGDVEERAESARSTILSIASAGSIVVILIVFLFGVRRGKRKTTIVEVRRY